MTDVAPFDSKSNHPYSLRTKHLAVRLFPEAAAGGQGLHVFNGPPGDPSQPQVALNLAL